METYNIEFVITDIDGVVVDRMPFYRSAFSSVLLRFGIPAEFAGQYFYDSAGTPVREQFKRALNRFNIDFSDQMIDDLVEEFWKTYGTPEAKLFPGVAEVLRKIKASGRRLLATSGSNASDLGDMIIKNMLPYDFFLGSDRVPKGDKHIELFAKHYSLELGEFCKRAILIGDGPADMELAKRNGIKGIGITNTVSGEKLRVAGATEIISELVEILAYLD